MKRTVTTALLGMAYLALGLSAVAANTGERTYNAYSVLPNLTYSTEEIVDPSEELCTEDSAELARFLCPEPKDTNEVRIEIDGIEAEAGLVEAISKVVAISTEEAAKFSAQMAEIEALVASGELTEEEGRERAEALEAEFEARMEKVGESMEAWGEEFGKRMEAWGENFGKKWESKAEEMEMDIEKEIVEGMKKDFDIDVEVEDEDQEEKKEEKNEKKKNKTKFSVSEFHFGANSFRDAQGNATGSEDMLSGWQSLNSRFMISTKRKIFGPASPLVFQSGLQIEGNTFSFSGNNTIVKVPGANAGDDATTEIVPVTNMTDVRRNRLSLAYLEIPLMLHLDFSPRGKVDKSISLGVGGYGGIRLDSRSTLLGNDSEGERALIITANNYNTTLLRYGVQAQVGYKAWKVTGRLDARPLFQPGAFTEDVTVGSVSLGVTL